MTTTPDTKAITADDLFNALTVRYDAPWVLKREVTLNTRRIDVVAFGMPGSTGCRIIAFELKVSRSDWLRELANFRKSEAWMAEADAFILVTTPGIVQPGELPARWGHLEFTGKQLRTKAHAEYRDHRGAMSRELAMRIIRSAHAEADSIISRERFQMEHAAREKIKAQLEESHQRESRHLREELARARKELDAIYEAFGCSGGSGTAMRGCCAVSGCWPRRWRRAGSAMCRMSSPTCETSSQTRRNA